MIDAVAEFKRLMAEENRVEEAIKVLRDAAESGIADAKFELGLLYYFGKFVPGDLDRAWEWLEKAHQDGDMRAPLYLGTLCAADSVQWYRRGVERGDDVAMVRLGRVYLIGIGVDRSVAKAFEFFEKAKDAGNFYGHGRYINLLLRGQKGIGGFFMAFCELFKVFYQIQKFSRSHSHKELLRKFEK